MLVEKGEGRYVQVRGVASNLNNVTINGVQMGSPEVELGGRQAPLDIISGGVLGGVQVIKTPTPDMDAQGIGGTVNIETKMPFDRRTISTAISPVAMAMRKSARAPRPSAAMIPTLSMEQCPERSATRSAGWSAGRFRRGNTSRPASIRTTGHRFRANPPARSCLST